MTLATQLLALGCAVWVAAIITLFTAIHRAPVGYEDQSGFHTGIPQVSPVHLPRQHSDSVRGQVPELRRVGEGAFDFHASGDTHA